MSFTIHDKLNAVLKEVLRHGDKSHITIVTADKSGTTINAFIAENIEKLKNLLIKEKYITLKELTKEQCSLLWQTKDIKQVLDLSNICYWKCNFNHIKNEDTLQIENTTYENDFDLEQ